MRFLWEIVDFKTKTVLVSCIGGRKGLDQSYVALLFQNLYMKFRYYFIFISALQIV